MEAIIWSNLVIKYEKNPGNGDDSYLRDAYFLNQDDYQYPSEGGVGDAQYANTNLTALGFNQATIHGEECIDPNCMPAQPNLDDVERELRKPYGIVGLFAHSNPFGFWVRTKGLRGTPIYKFVTIDGGPRPPDQYGEARLIDLDDPAEPRKIWDYPRIGLFSGCSQAELDVDGTLSEALSIDQPACPAILSHTRYGFTAASTFWHMQIIKLMCAGGTDTLSINPNVDPGGFFDMILTAAGDTMSLGQPETFSALFYDSDRSGTTALSWGFSLVFFHSEGEKVFSSADNIAGNPEAFWTTIVDSLPQGYMWEYDAAGYVRGRLHIGAIDSDGFSHRAYIDVALANASGMPFPQEKLFGAGQEDMDRFVEAYFNRIAVAQTQMRARYPDINTADRVINYLNRSYILIGDPELTFRTGRKSIFQNVSIVVTPGAGTSITVATGVPSASICVTNSAGTYYQRASNFATYTFTGISSNHYPLQVTISANGYKLYSQTVNKPTPVPAMGFIWFVALGALMVISGVFFGFLRSRNATVQNA
jgi:hypothetical protein